MTQLADLSIKAFLDKTAGSDPVPGGGSVSALNGSIASALAEMVANLTIGRKKYVEVEGIMTELAPKFNDLRKRMEEYIDRDSDAYNKVFDAYKLPKDTDQEKQLRKETIQQATEYAAMIPMEVARAVFEILPAIETVARKGNQNAITDACVAMMCARNAVLGALLNVRINLTSIENATFVDNLANEAARIEKETVETERELMEYVKTQIGM